jgi:hypothetical protein
MPITPSPCCSRKKGLPRTAGRHADGRPVGCFAPLPVAATPPAPAPSGAAPSDAAPSVVAPNRAGRRPALSRHACLCCAPALAGGAGDLSE